MGNLVFYLGIPVLFFSELCLFGAGSPHFMLLAYCFTLICGKQSLIRVMYAAVFAAAAAIAHGASITPVVAGLLAGGIVWFFFQQTLTRNWLTQSVVIVLFMVAMLALGGDFSWTAPFVIANIIIVPVMVWLWCGV